LETVADFIGRHAVICLAALSVVLMLITVLVWRLVERFWEDGWRIAEGAWARLSDSVVGAAARRIPLLRASFDRTLSAWRYLGLHAVLSIAVAIAGVVAFVELADEIGARDELGQFDELLAAALREHADEATLNAFAAITHLGDRSITIAIGAFVALILLIRRWWLHAAVWVLATGGGGLLISALKSVFERGRPLHDHALTDTTGYSFPSGHASGAVLVYGALAYLLIRHTPRVWRLPIAIAAIVVITFVGFSRVILHVHYLSDVLAGFVVAATWIAMCIAAFEVMRRRGRVAHEHAPPVDPR